jgi:hypothetical protein
MKNLHCSSQDAHCLSNFLRLVTGTFETELM